MNKDEMIEARAEERYNQVFMNSIEAGFVEPWEDYKRIHSPCSFEKEATAEYKYWSKVFSRLPTPNREELREKIKDANRTLAINLKGFYLHDKLSVLELGETDYERYTSIIKSHADSILVLLPEYEEVNLPENKTEKLCCWQGVNHFIADIPKGSDGKLWRLKG